MIICKTDGLAFQSIGFVNTFVQWHRIWITMGELVNWEQQLTQRNSVFYAVHADVIKGGHLDKGYNWATLFLEEINTGTWLSRWGNLKLETVKFGHESRGTRTRERLRWRGPAAILNYIHIHLILFLPIALRCSGQKNNYFWKYL
jgi:hypothetical protein